MEEENNSVQKVEPLSSKDKKISLTLLITSTIFGVVSILAGIYVTSLFQANLDIFDSHDLSVLAIIVTIPIFLLACFAQLVSAIPAFVVSLSNVIRFKIKNPIYIILVVLWGLSILYPIIMFLTLIYMPHGSGDTSSSVSDISSETALLLF